MKATYAAVGPGPTLSQPSSSPSLSGVRWGVEGDACCAAPVIVLTGARRRTLADPARRVLGSDRRLSPALRELVSVASSCCSFVDWRMIGDDQGHLLLVVTGTPEQLAALGIG